MTKDPAKRAANKSKGLVLGLDVFERISAVEGVLLSPEMKQDLQTFEDQQMTGEQRTRFITGKYGKKLD